jgi:hypothetical protein
MRTVEFVVIHVVSLALEERHYPATALVDRENLIARPVGDEQARAGVRVDGKDEPGRKRDHAME